MSKINKWLENPDFLDKISFKDKYYLETLFHKIAAFIKNAPIPILSTWDNEHKSIYLSIGENKQFFTVSTDIAYYDVITLMRKWCIKFYPQYEIELEKQVEYTDEEIVEELVGKQGMNLNDAILARKTIKYIEKGIIEKVYFGDNENRDRFVLNVNGVQQLRLSGNITKGIIMPISEFMDGIRKFSKEKEKYTQQDVKNYIELNSRFIKELKQENEILINYSGRQMLNFIDINFDLLYPEYDLTQLPNNDFTFVWGRFKLTFNSKILIDDCLALYNKKIIKMYK
jgi:hypothetical protein